MDDKIQTLSVDLNREKVHTRLSQKFEFNNFSHWLEPGKKDNVPTWHLLRLGKSMYWSITKDVKNGAAKKSWKLPMYHHCG